jgi:hypothetical protein
MNTITELEREVMALPPTEGEKLATAAWESLVTDPSAPSDRGIDPEGIDLALQRDAEIEAGTIKSINHAEFMRRTGANRVMTCSL